MHQVNASDIQCIRQSTPTSAAGQVGSVVVEREGAVLVEGCNGAVGVASLSESWQAYPAASTASTDSKRFSHSVGLSTACTWVAAARGAVERAARCSGKVNVFCYNTACCGVAKLAPSPHVPNEAQCPC